MKLWCTIIFLAGIAFSHLSWASCVPGGNFSVSYGTITVQRDVVVGQPISDWLVSSQGVVYQNCNYDNVPQYPISSGIKSTNSRASITWNGEAVFNTNISGVGFVLEGRTSFDSTPLPNSWTGIESGQSQVFPALTSHISGDHPSINAQMRLRLIKTGEITPGTLSGSVGRFIAGTRDNAGWSTEVPVTFSGGQIMNVGCTVTTPDVSVLLGPHKKSEFSGPGTATEWKTFTIGLNCDKSAHINVQIDGTHVPSGANGVMALDSEAGDMAATGVGVQLFFTPDNSPVTFGQSKDYYTSPYGGTETVQLKARYYQTGATMTAGTANATATFTLTYR